MVNIVSMKINIGYKGYRKNMINLDLSKLANKIIKNQKKFNFFMIVAIMLAIILTMLTKKSFENKNYFFILLIVLIYNVIGIYKGILRKK
ncbi:hypothetical protein C3495_07295 [Clostridiaceae bacterium 14S0207]|nr:hypothetical protein C3495_07295 [Clostridiaceae bacterium 14S0207]